MATKPIIGLAGGIGAGKSTVARILADAGAVVIDADALNRAELAAPDVVATLRDWWGGRVVNPAGTVDRAAVAEIIFADPVARRRLEALLHPRIARARDALIVRSQADPAVRWIVLDAPLLFEVGLDALCRVTIFVEAADAVRYERVRLGRGWTRSEWARREKSQYPLDKKRGRADYVVVNNSSDLETLRSSMHEILTKVDDSTRPV